MQLENTTFSVVLQGTGYAEDDDKSKPPSSKITVKVWGIGKQVVSPPPPPQFTLISPNYKVYTVFVPLGALSTE